MGKDFLHVLINKKSVINVNGFSFRIAEINSCKGALHGNVLAVTPFMHFGKKKT